MTILQNAYNAYLTTKYDKEINEFKELALSVINNAELKLREELQIHTVHSDNKVGADRVTKELISLFEIDRLIKNNTLEIECRLFNKPYIDSLVTEYQKLKDLIVNGESVVIDMSKYKWDETIDKQGVTIILNEQWNEVSSKLKKKVLDVGSSTEITLNQIAGAIIEVSEVLRKSKLLNKDMSFTKLDDLTEEVVKKLTKILLDN